ncbi:MAG: hypothetical protein K5917_08350 [Clostridiales bacterium]|nr:hypothetical protein [Clostridiales bacterium]
MKNYDNFLILGGDKRYAYMAQELYNNGYSVALSGFDNCEGFEEIKRENIKVLSDYKNIVLPAPITRDMLTLNAPLSKFKIDLNEIYSLLTAENFVFCGKAGSEILDMLDKRAGGKFIYFSDFEYTSKNAELTALAVEKILNNENKDLKEYNCLITGYGFTGKALSKKLKDKFRSITVCARRDEVLKKISSDGFDALKLSCLKEHISYYDIVINTVPSVIINADILDFVKESVFIVDIASAPFGVDFGYAQEKNIRAEKALGLPGKYFPEKAGKILAKTILKKI